MDFILFALLKLLLADKRSFKAIAKGILHLGTADLAAIFLAAVVLIPAFESYPLITRSEGLPVEQLSKTSLPPVYLLNAIFPFLGTTRLYPSRLSRIFFNSGIGLIGMIFALYYFLFCNKKKLKWVILILFLLALALSFGIRTPGYSWAFKNSSLFQLIRVPAFDYRALFIFFLCLAAGLGVKAFEENADGGRKRLLLLVIAVPLIGVLLASLGRVGDHIGIINRLGDNLFWFLPLFLLGGLLALKLDFKIILPILLLLTMIDVSHWVRVNFRTMARPAYEDEWDGIKRNERERITKVDEKSVLLRRADYPEIKSNYSMILKKFSDSGYDSTGLKVFHSIIDSPATGLWTENFRVLPL